MVRVVPVVMATWFTPIIGGQAQMVTMVALVLMAKAAAVVAAAAVVIQGLMPAEPVAGAAVPEVAGRPIMGVAVMVPAAALAFLLFPVQLK